MGVKRTRRSIQAMIDRWEKDNERLIAMFGKFKAEDSDPFSETQRNLATATAEAWGILAASDEYLRSRTVNAQEPRP